MRQISVVFAFLLVLCLPAMQAHADAPLASTLGLDMAQARQVDQIQARQRKEFASLRQDYNRESRALRRAKLANDVAETARLTRLTDTMRADLTRLRAQYDDEIRAVLRPDQSRRFDAWIAERQQMRGSSRDEWIF
jgi:Spy/CpxP family protein refolding chaperone